MTKNLIVQKYGGTSVGTIENIKMIAQKVVRVRASGKDLVVVVSAMAGETDRLLGLAGQISKDLDRREIDMLLSSGERISSALLTLALHALGCPAVSLTGRQMGVLTDNSHTRARIKQIDCERTKSLLKKKHVIVAAGFQGINEQGDVTTLGRGGSDTSAVALATALDAEMCEIYTDVDGVYTADPRIVPTAHKLHRVSFDEMLEMASLGAKVLQIRCVEFAKNYNMPVIVKSSFKEESDPGTLICRENPSMEQPVVSGVMCDKNQAKITVKGLPDHPGVAARVFLPLSEAAISVDMIIQNMSDHGLTDISFTLPRTEMNEARKIIESRAEKIDAKEIVCDDNISKISIVGAGMRSHSGVAAHMFKLLSGEGINILMISTSEIRISCVIKEKYSELAVRTLHEGIGIKRETLSIQGSKKDTPTEDRKTTL
tara:strand:+ start:5274 stop:6563 length:1290 start_codon:yes stop_codon:yes gene_type:complete